MTQDTGALALPSGSRASREASTSLHPSGFDPSRYAILGREIGTGKAMSVSYTNHAEHLDEVIEAVTPYRRECEYTVIPRGQECEGKNWFQRTIDAASHLPWVSKNTLAAIAMETRRAETENTGSVAKP